MDLKQTYLERIAAGDPSAVGECLEKYRGLVWSMARQFAGNHADAEDAVQEVFIELWRYAGRYSPALAAESTFVATVARRRLVNRWRRRSRRPQPVALAVEPIANTASESALRETEEAGRHARTLFEKLRPEQRQVLELSFDRGMSHQEIADTTKLPLGTVKTHARRGLMRLRQLLEASRSASESGTPPAQPNERPSP